MCRALCMPPQQISPSAARRSPNSSAMSHAAPKRIGDSLRVRLRIRGPLGRRAGRIDAHDAVRANADLPQRASDSAALCELALETAFAPHRRPLPSRRPSAAKPARRPTRRPIRRLRIFDASSSNCSSVESMLTCGSNRKRSTPSNRCPFTSAAAVSSSIVSRPIGGSLPSPLPTTPGQAAL